jgi:uncharacterized protein YbjT (DUF2867 family)
MELDNRNESYLVFGSTGRSGEEIVRELLN